MRWSWFAVGWRGAGNTGWLFGGQAWDARSTALLDDLWQIDLADGEWELQRTAIRLVRCVLPTCPPDHWAAVITAVAEEGKNLVEQEQENEDEDGDAFTSSSTAAAGRGGEGFPCSDRRHVVIHHLLSLVGACYSSAALGAHEGENAPAATREEEEKLVHGDTQNDDSESKHESKDEDVMIESKNPTPTEVAAGADGRVANRRAG